MNTTPVTSEFLGRVTKEEEAAELQALPFAARWQRDCGSRGISRHGVSSRLALNWPDHDHGEGAGGQNLLVSPSCGAVVRPTHGSYSVLMSASGWLAGVGYGAADAVVVSRHQLRCAARERTSRESHEATVTAGGSARRRGGGSDC